ncbi:MAG: VWA domain-containing protein [Bacteroidia bacterium]|nr:VWA domain-containing protein [Bacteroidia bacterium]
MYRLILFILLIPFGLNAQLSPDKTLVDFGQIALFNNDTAYFNFTNTGIKTIYLLSTQPADDYSVHVSSKTIGPGESIIVGIVYYTDKKGKFSINVPLSFSHSGTPITLQVKGQIKAINETAYTKCPSIENSKPLQASQIPLTIIIRDAETLEFLSADIKVQRARFEYNCVSGINSKNYKCNCGYGPLLIETSKKGYIPHSENFLYDPTHYTVIVDLVKEQKDTLIENKTTIISQEEFPYEPPKTETNDSFVPEYSYITSSVNDSGFNSLRYKPNHLIFIIDVSGSMKDSTKLFYLKKAMTRLILSARPQDHITLITYAYKVKVIFENYSGLDRGAMLMAIDTLTASGGSNGAKSLIMAYEIAKNHFITGGNNQIFLATDGLLNSSSVDNDDLYKLARKGYNNEQVILSSIGFGKDEKALEFLRKLAKLGHGNFLRINNIDSDIEVLIEEVKLQSLSKP